MKWRQFTLCIMLTAFLTSCSAGNENVQDMPKESAAGDSAVSEVIEPMPQTKITMCCDRDVSSLLQKSIDVFNAADNGYFIELNDYSRYLELPPSDYEGDDLAELIERANLKFDEDVFSDIKGGGSDIICRMTSTAAFEKLRNEGGLADLYDLADEGDMDDLNRHIIDLCETGGRLYEMPYSYDLNTIIGAKEYLGDRTSWTIDDAAAVCDSLPGDVQFSSKNYRGGIAHLFINDLRAYVDETESGRELRADELKKALDLCMRFERDPKALSADSIKEKYLLELVDGVYNFREYSSAIHKFTEKNGECTIIGFPSEKGYSASLGIIDSFGINADSPENVQKGAWEFLKFAVSEKEQSGVGVGFPVNQKAFDSKAREMLSDGSLAQQEYEDMLNCINNAVLYDKVLERELMNVFDYEHIDVIEELVSVEQAVGDIGERVRKMK